MHTKQLTFDEGFRVAFEVRDAQAAEMTLAPGDSTGGLDNYHRGADQWLYVVEGRGEAMLRCEDGDQRVELASGTLLVIERGERHEIRNTGDGPLRTLNVYSPPAFAGDGTPRGPGKK